ncbi:MAG: phospholipase A1 [Alteromonadaceae bacterium]|jgi:phospholipase A1
MKNIKILLVSFSTLFLSLHSYARESIDAVVMSACIAEISKSADDNETVGEIKRACRRKINNPLEKRRVLEKHASSNPFSILPYKPNYILPVTYSKAIKQPYLENLQGRDLDDFEAKFQMSLKYVVVEDLLFDELSLSTTLTTTSWWQSYNSDISAPFRETNYEPELLFNYSRAWNFFGLEVSNTSLSFNHQSNGQSGKLSRSWNRVIAGFIIADDNIIWNLKTWWRVPENAKQSINSPKGDDNPNIENYLGYGELGVLWKIDNDHNLEIGFRNNLRRNNKSTIQLGWSFPLNNHLRGYVEYFNGYGESLIYYDRHSSRLGIGLKLTDWL